MSRQSYAKYWSSGVEWLGDLPDHWQLPRLKYAKSINDETLAEDIRATLRLTDDWAAELDSWEQALVRLRQVIDSGRYPGRDERSRGQ